MHKDPISLAQKLISFKSITPLDDGIIDFLINYLSPYGFDCKKLVFEEVTNLYARYGNAGPNFCFAGHTDVVPPGNNWSIDPFAGIIKDGMLYGRGASDMKAAIAAFIIASTEFIQNNSFNGSISFLITGDEEGKAENGTVKVLESLKEQKIDACIIGEPTCPEHLGDMIKYGRRGSISFDLIIKGKQGHVAYPDLADNPIDYQLKILNEIKALVLDNGNEDFMPSNLEITDINVNNPIRNVIPAKAEAKFNIRFNNLHNSESLYKLINSICLKYSKNYELKSYLSGEAFVNSKDSGLITALQSAISQITGKNAKLSTTGGISDARFIKDYCPVIEFGLVNKTAHHVDEHVFAKDIVKLKEIYLMFLKKYFGCL
jgi:succinyl-diaminopimelate desuccinylase